MIKFTLRCDREHEFESWFADSETFETQSRRGFVQCAFCDSVQVSKAIMAPAVRASRETTAAQPFAMVDEGHREFREALRELRRKIDANTTDVGVRFPDVARAMHSGEAPDRAIRGQASPEDAQALLREGIGILPIPPLPDEAN